MAQHDFIYHNHVVNGLVPAADRFNGDPSTDWVSLANYNRVTFLIHTGDATGGTANAVVTVNSSAVAAGSNPTALAFKYRSCASSTTVDTWSELTDAASTGFAMTAGDNYIYAVEVTADEVSAQDADGVFVSCNINEDANDPIVGSVLIILSEPRYAQEVPVSAIA